MPTITIYPWMLHELHLQGAALLVFALWFTDRQDRTPRQLAGILCFSEFCIRKVMPQVRLAQQSCITTQQSCQQSCEEREKNQKRKENPTKGNISTTTTLNKEQFVNLIFSCFLADADYMKRLCDMFEIAGAEVGDMQKMKEGLTPYVISFARLLRMHKTDLEKKGAEDTKSHFFNWMQAGNYQRIARALERAAEKKEREAVHTPSPQAVPSPYLRGRVAQQLTEEQQAEQMLQKRRRMEKAEEVQRHMDEIRRAADSCTDTTARDRVFARFGRNKTKGSG